MRFCAAPQHPQSYDPHHPAPPLARFLLPALQDHIAIGGINLQQYRAPPGAFSSDHRRPRSAKAIQHRIARFAAVADGALD
jgi:hypothetical protein